MLFHNDNTRFHTSLKTKSKLDEVGGVELMSHLVFHPDFAPSDFHFSQSMAHFLSGLTFVNVEEVEQGCYEFFVSEPKEWYL